jgi:hypothetical protein
MGVCFGKVHKRETSLSSVYPKYCCNGKYKRNSFDRFGDDFCELILSYLDNDDKTRLQYVNSQWRRCIFGRVYEFKYPLELLNLKYICEKKRLEISTDVLKKCRFIKKLKVTINCDGNILKLITENCKFLEHLEVKFKFNEFVYFNNDVLREFSIKCGKNLKFLKIGLQSIVLFTKLLLQNFLTVFIF